jgi:hypothetical protein
MGAVEGAGGTLRVGLSSKGVMATKGLHCQQAQGYARGDHTAWSRQE